jgi:hypothetical protein
LVAEEDDAGSEPGVEVKDGNGVGVCLGRGVAVFTTVHELNRQMTAGMTNLVPTCRAMDKTCRANVIIYDRPLSVDVFRKNMILLHPFELSLFSK